MSKFPNDVLILCNFFEKIFEEFGVGIVNFRLVCKTWKNEIDHVSWSVRLKDHHSRVSEMLREYEDFTTLTFNDLRFSLEDVISYLVVYCCNWMGTVFKPKTTKDIIQYCTLPSFFKDEATKSIVLIDSVWSNSKLSFENFLNNSFEHYLTILLLLLACDENFIYRVMRLKNNLVREFILLMTGFSSLRSRKNFQEEPFVMTIYEPIDYMYFPTMHMFATDEIIPDTDLKTLIPYHQRQILMALTSIFSYQRNYNVFPHLKSFVINLGENFRVPCYDTRLKIVGLQDLFKLTNNYNTNYYFCEKCDHYKGIGCNCDRNTK